MNIGGHHPSPLSEGEWGLIFYNEQSIVIPFSLDRGNSLSFQSVISIILWLGKIFPLDKASS